MENMEPHQRPPRAVYRRTQPLCAIWLSWRRYALRICSAHESKTPRQGSSSISPSPLPSPTSLPSPAVVRAAGAGLGPFFTPTGFGTLVAEGKEQRVIDGKGYILEQPLHGDVALVRAHLGDRWGNLTYRWAARNFGPVMCMAAKYSIAQVNRVVSLGDLPPEQVMTPGIFVQAVVATGGER